MRIQPPGPCGHGRPRGDAGSVPRRTAAVRLPARRRRPAPEPGEGRRRERLTSLEPDPTTAPIVRRIFDLYLSGGRGLQGDRPASSTADGIASARARTTPAATPTDTDSPGGSRGPGHLCNPRYTGYRSSAVSVARRCSLDVEDVSAGHQTLMRWKARSEWVWSDEPAHEALDRRETWQRAQSG